jgi:hypothetical protein
MLPLFLSFGSHISEPTDLWQTRIDAAVPSQIDGGRRGGRTLRRAPPRRWL